MNGIRAASLHTFEKANDVSAKEAYIDQKLI